MSDSKTHTGARVGVELEFGGLDVDRASASVVACLGGHVRDASDSRYERDVRDTRLGDFVVEMDAEPLKRWGRQQDPGEPSALRVLATDLVDRIASEVVPCEIVAPPVARADLPELERLVADLGARGARGTYEALRFGFGVHFNPEVLEPEVISVLSHMRAFAVLHASLLDEFHVDPTRRISSYIDGWPTDYVRTIASPEYAPASFEVLIDDYLAATQSRNHALDMLPLFAHLDEERVRAATADELINKRPTYHYRLCNCRVGEPGWRLTQEWSSWLRVEALAAQPDALDDACTAYLDALAAPLRLLGS